jgi:hypothetical protein
MMVSMPRGATTRTRELVRQMMKLLDESEADYCECAHAVMYVMCALFATSGDSTADIVDQLDGVISTLVDANREASTETGAVN